MPGIETDARDVELGILFIQSGLLAVDRVWYESSEKGSIIIVGGWVEVSGRRVLL